MILEAKLVKSEDEYGKMQAGRKDVSRDDVRAFGQNGGGGSSVAVVEHNTRFC